MAEEKIVSPIKGQPTAQQPAQTAQTQADSAVVKPDNVELPAAHEKPADATPDVDSLIPTDPYNISPLFYEVANYFGVKQEDYGNIKNKLSEIVDYTIRDIKSNDPSKILLRLREYEDRLEKPQFGERRYDILYRYIRLGSQKQAVEEAMKAFETKEARSGQ